MQRPGIIGAAVLTAFVVAARGSAQPVRRVVQATSPEPRVELREALRIGSLDGRDDSFGQIADVALDRHGRVYVADNQAHQVAVFDSAGHLVARLGREGGGPGEFRNPWLVRIDAADSVFVWDVTAARISVFDPALRFRRSFRTPPQWIVNGLEFLPGGDLLIAAYGSGEQRPLHRFTRDGTRVASFGPTLSGEHLGGFERSLLGGDVAVEGSLLVYSNKSPYELDFYDLAGRVRGRCLGRPGWTTPPDAVVIDSADAHLLRWGSYVHSTRVIALGNGLFANVVHDPRTRRDTIDLLTSDCRLLRRTPLDTPVTIVSRRGRRVAALRMLDYPEVVVYEMSIAPR